MWKIKLSKEPKTKYRLYSPTAMTSAFQKVIETGGSMRKIAKEYGIPEDSLRHRVSGYVNPEVTRSGHQTLFTQEEEAHLADHLKFTASVGYGYSRTEVLNIATEYAVCLGYRARGDGVSLRWLQKYVSRWPDLKVIKPRSLQMQRAKATSVQCINAYYAELYKILMKYDLMDKPERIYNVDEKGLSTTHKPPNVVAATRTKPPAVTSSTRLNITIIGCGNAVGQHIPPFLIFPGLRMRQELLEGRTTGADGAVTESGWSNSDIFRQYIETHLIKYLPERNHEQPVLLLYDGYKSHVSMELIEWAKTNHIILFVLPAHTSHVLQPMDVGCFGPFERIFNNKCHKYMREHCGESVTRNNICAIACRAYSEALSPENLHGAFRKAGIYPYNPNAVEMSNFEPASVLEQEEEKSAEKEKAVEQSTSFFDMKESVIIKKKAKSKKRRYLSTIVSGKAITEDDMIDRIEEHQSKSNGKSKSLCKSTKKSTKNEKDKRKIECMQMTTGEINNHGPYDLSPKPGPSHYQADFLSDSEVSIEDIEKCCICNQFTPAEVKNSISLIFTKWVQCDKCPHWVHLIYCTDKRVVRRGDTFICTHCIEE